MKKIEEKVLLCNFHDENTIHKIQLICKAMKIEYHIVPPDAWDQKIGYLLGKNGFTFARSDKTNGFSCTNEILILSHLKNKRLDQFLLSLKNEGVPPIRYKAVATPFNIFWTLRRLCETMQREHREMMEWKKQNEKS